MSRARKMFQVPIPTTVNREGYPAYERSLEEQYLQVLLTNTLGNTFYATAEDLLQEADKIHDAMIDKDPEFAAKALTFARNVGCMRLQPVFGLAKLSKVRPNIMAKVFNYVILIPSDLQDFFAVLNGQGRGQGGRAIKRAAADWIGGKLTEYWALKYDGRGRGYSLGDILATVHPKPLDEWQKNLFAYLRGQEYDRSLLQQISAFERLKKAETDEERIKAIQQGRLPHEIVTGAVKMTPALWEALLPTMPVFATLRHLNALHRAGMLGRNKDLIRDKFTPEAIKKAKILPFRFLDALDATSDIGASWVADMLRSAIEHTFDSLPEISGKTAVIVDVSGSMAGNYIKIASVFAAALFKKTDGDLPIILFNEGAENFVASKFDSILTQADAIKRKVRGSTNPAAGIESLTKAKTRVDNIIMLTDEQQNVGNMMYSALLGYRRVVNSQAKMFAVALAPYTRGHMIPQSDRSTWYIYGWSEQVLNFIGLAAQGFGDMVDVVRNMGI